MTERQFIEAYQAHWAKVYRYCFFRTNSRSEAEDLTADVFRRLLEARRQPEADALLPWLYRVAKNLCINQQKSESLHRLHARLLGKTSEPVAEDQRGAWRDSELLTAVRTLKAREQQILFLRVFEDLSFSEIGQILGISESAAKVAFHRSTRTLRNLLDEPAISPGTRVAALGIGSEEGENYGI